MNKNGSTSYICPCGMTLLNLKPVNVAINKPKVDDIMLCGAYGKPSKVTLFGLVYLTDAEFILLSPEEQKGLNFAQRAIKRSVRA